MSQLNLDPARLTTIRARVGRAASFKYIFLQADGSPYDISASAFEWFIKKHKDLPGKILSLTIGSGLTIGGAGNNELTVTLTQANANLLQEHRYHHELVNTTAIKTWFNGPFIAHQGEFDGGTDTDELAGQVNLGDVTVDVEISIVEQDLDIDGGSAAAVYAADQVIDGGDA